MLFSLPKERQENPSPSGSLGAKCQCLSNWICHCLLRCSIDIGHKFQTARRHSHLCLSLPREQTVLFYPLDNNSAYRGNRGTRQTHKSIRKCSHFVTSGNSWGAGEGVGKKGEGRLVGKEFTMVGREGCVWGGVGSDRKGGDCVGTLSLSSLLLGWSKPLLRAVCRGAGAFNPFPFTPLSGESRGVSARLAP